MNVMQTAWNIATEAAAKFGGKRSEFFVESLKLAWKQTKEGSEMSIVEKMIEMGGKEWTDGDHHRVYFNNYDELGGLEITKYKTGNISSAKLNGEGISNSKAYKMTSGKLYFDVNNSEFVAQYFNDSTVADAAIAAISEKCGL